ncbi:MAG: 1-acyl-sn-glycerol-3-phosphate acyltransferase [Spirochaetia bacterium]|uniref:1-acyl-sn-glycerol-3-phosphate acyltransferase n=1 Tax=Treponema sp. TaxID=166 RepID=UPI00298E38DC|nr:1-acyl-sn-glycerol-3-phosphate acyltransferase [Treponema sp.]MCI7578250.1 1-acyl-sn-glycerol-3-phosphate acyltransferase [Spirochaetia bacterium]
MEINTIRSMYGPYFKQLAGNSVAAAKIDASNVYQPANEKNRFLIDKLVSDNILPESHIGAKENFLDFYRQVKEGKSGLILMEHYANTDLPAIMYMLAHDGDPELAELSKKIVAIAGMKLNEDDSIVRAFAESFTRVVIYPTRSLDKNAKDVSEDEAKEEEMKARKINLAAMHAMDDCKRRGEVILVFPSGTRYRPGHPETKRGLKEIDSYLRLFDVAILVSINGSILQIQEGKEDMLSDIVVQDKVVITASPVINCKQFRKDYLATLPADEADPKQKVIDRVMQILEEQHDKVEETRLK